MIAEYDDLDALDLAALIRGGDATAEEVLETAIDRVERRNPAVNAVIQPLYDHARAAIAAGLPDGPFTGVPYLLKALTAALEGQPTTRASKYFESWIAPHDSEHVRRLKAAGFVIFGRTNTCELGLSLTCEPAYYGATRNPWNPERISGGSSGGAAAAVAARMLPMAHATDGFGSIRAPAACCGLVGLKPSRGRTSMAPYLGEGLNGLACEHAVSLSVRDSAALLDVTAGAAPGDPYAAPPPRQGFLAATRTPPRSLRIGLMARGYTDAEVDPECLLVLQETAALCAELGHTVEPVEPIYERDAVVMTFLAIMAVNMDANLAANPVLERPAREDEVEPITWGCAELGRRLGGADLVRALQTAHRLGREMAAVHAEYDLLLTPGLARPAVELGHLDMQMSDLNLYWRRVFDFSPFTVLFNLTGQPACMLPLGQSADGLPIAVQIAGPYGDEETVLALAAQLEQARPWRDRRPELA